MQTIQQSISQSVKLLDAIIAGDIKRQEMEDTLNGLLAEPMSARGFMAALSTSTIALKGDFLQALLASVRKNPDTSYDLIVKNIVMSAMTAQENEAKNADSQGSKAVTMRMLLLARALDEPALKETIATLITAIQNFADEVTGEDGKQYPDKQEYWFEFFHRWHYEPKALRKIVPLLSI